MRACLTKNLRRTVSLIPILSFNVILSKCLRCDNNEVSVFSAFIFVHISTKSPVEQLALLLMMA